MEFEEINLLRTPKKKKKSPLKVLVPFAVNFAQQIMGIFYWIVSHFKRRSEVGNPAQEF